MTGWPGHLLYQRLRTSDLEAMRVPLMSHASMRSKFARRPRCNELARVLPANRCYAGTVERGANPMRPSILAVATLVVLMCASARAHTSSYCEVQKGDFPHDVAAGVSGEVWYAGQNAGDEQPNRMHLPRQECSTIRRNRGAGRRALVSPGDRGTRRVWSDSRGGLWISEWNSGNVSVFDPSSKS
jgi:streptogramin lyase